MTDCDDENDSSESCVVVVVVPKSFYFSAQCLILFIHRKIHMFLSRICL